MLRNGRTSLLVKASYVIVLAFIPAILFNLVLFSIKQFYPLQRPPINIDYMIVSITFLYGNFVFWITSAIVFILDLINSVLPGFHLNGPLLIQAIKNVFEVSFIELSKVCFATVIVLLLILSLSQMPKKYSTTIISNKPAKRKIVIFLLAILNLMIFNAGNENTTFTSKIWQTTTWFTRPLQPADIHSVKSASAPLFEKHARKHNKLLVIVESWGASNDIEVRQVYIDAVKNSLGTEYYITSGTVKNIGTTVGAEMRELCQLGYPTYAPDLEKFDKSKCLPRTLSERGYETLAIHNYTASMFNREWLYESLGFDNAFFREELTEIWPSIRTCKGWHPAPCDSAILSHMSEQIGKDREFVYWLTLTGHYPPPTPENRVPACEVLKESKVTSRYCRYQGQVSRVLNTISKFIEQREELWDVVIVGDHMPRFLSEKGKKRYIKSRVPYIRIAPMSRRVGQ